MSVFQQLLTIFGASAAILTIASAIGYVLKKRQPGDTPSPFVENLNARTRSWWAILALLALAFAFGKAGVIILFALLSFAALRESLTLAYTRFGDHWALLVAFFVVLPVQYLLIWDGWYGLYTVFIPVYAFLVMPIVSAVRGETERFLERISEVQWALMISVFCLSHVPALLTLQIPGYEGHDLLLVAFLLIVVQMSDVFQYVWGKLIGRRKIAPSLSPSKTVEGFVGGVGSATALGAALWWITPFAPWQAASLAFVIAMMGFFGGLVMSAVKRDRGVKDWGWSVEGHGGVLDRLDSVVFAAPIFFHLVRYWWAV